MSNGASFKELLARHAEGDALARLVEDFEYDEILRLIQDMNKE